MKQIKLYLGTEHPCSYLPGRRANSAYVDPGMELDTRTYSRLAELGFRRSGDMAYRPHCRACKACVPVRIPVERFLPDRSQMRNLRANIDLAAAPRPAEFVEEHYRLFSRYQQARHREGGMGDSSPEDYLGFLGSRWANTSFVEFRAKDKLLAVAVVDRLENGLSAVYTFFDPDCAQRGMGTYVVLWQIGEARRLGLEWLYLGYWIKECRKMNYKSRYRPIEAFVGEHWLRFEKGEKIEF